MKKVIIILGFFVIATLFSCQKESCWQCEATYGSHRITKEYCGDFAGMREIEHSSNGLYTKWDCSKR